MKFHYNELSGIDTEKEYVGVIAQDLKEVAPYMVGNFEQDGVEYFDVDNSAMTYVLINAVQEQQEQIENYKSQIEALKQELNASKASNTSLEARLEAIEAHLGIESQTKR